MTRMRTAQDKGGARGPSFDSQASSFDHRTGLPECARREIVEAVLARRPEMPGALLDLGAGTGNIGVHLAAEGRPGEARPYVALDLSLPMLGVFRRRLSVNAVTAGLLQADATAPWPLADGSVSLLFSSRAVHLLPLPHLIEEIRRLCRPGARLVLGSVQRPENSLRRIMRREMRRRLAAVGWRGRSAGGTRRRLQEALAHDGWLPEPTARLASWPVEERAIDSLQGWRDKPGLAGRHVPADQRHALLDELATWARREFGSLETTRTTTESYRLDVMRRGGGDAPVTATHR